MFLGGWLAMTLAMLPATLPAARLVGVARGISHAVVFVGGYAAVWVVVGLAGYLALSPLAVHRPGAALVLALAAAYELSPVKDACLRRCRSPLRLLMRSTPHATIAHAFDCACCCAALMALMLALGLMGFPWLLLLAAVVLVEKAAPFGERSSRGLALVLAAAAVVAWI